MEHIRGNPGVGHDLDKAPPDHRILSKARARFGPAWYEWFFGLIIWACRDAGLIDGDRLILDATLIKANASLDSLNSRPLHAQLPTAEDSLSQVWGEGPVEVEGPRDPEGPAVPKGHTGAAAIARGASSDQRCPRGTEEGPLRRSLSPQRACHPGAGDGIRTRNLLTTNLT